MRKPFEISPEAAALLERINQARRMNGITLEKIANECGISQSTVTNQLNGKRTLDIRVLMTISRLCPNVSAEWLIRGTGDILTNNN